MRRLRVLGLLIGLIGVAGTVVTPPGLAAPADSEIMLAAPSKAEPRSETMPLASESEASRLATESEATRLAAKSHSEALRPAGEAHPEVAWPAGEPHTEDSRHGTESQSKASRLAAESHSERIIFDGGGSEELNGIRYHSFRIPSLVRTNENTLIAFVEGRAADNADFGNINLLYKRSTNNGATWSGLSEVVGSGQGTWGNPTAVVDRSDNRVWLFMNHQPPASGTVNSWDDRQVWVSSSTDDGVSWSDPVNMSPTLKPRTLADGSSWNWDAVGPGVGIQTTYRNPGRLVIPAQHRNIYSDDHGRTWKVQVMRTTAGAPMEQTGESTVLELADGTLYRNDRPTTPAWESAKRRWVARGSIESGFTPFAPASCLLDPKNEAATMRYNADAPARLAFVNSASTETRTRMRIRMSEDEGRTWSYSRPFADAPLPLEGGNYREGGYVSIVKTADFHVGALVEVNENTASNSTSHRSIAFRKVNLPWIQGGVRDPGCAG